MQAESKIADSDYAAALVLLEGNEDAKASALYDYCSLKISLSAAAAITPTDSVTGDAFFSKYADILLRIEKLKSGQVHLKDAVLANYTQIASLHGTVLDEVNTITAQATANLDFFKSLDFIEELVVENYFNFNTINSQVDLCTVSLSSMVSTFKSLGSTSLVDAIKVNAEFSALWEDTAQCFKELLVVQITLSAALQSGDVKSASTNMFLDDEWILRLKDIPYDTDASGAADGIERVLLIHIMSLKFVKVA